MKNALPWSIIVLFLSESKIESTVGNIILIASRIIVGVNSNATETGKDLLAMVIRDTSLQ
tara:strand:- start:3223 stop:3402 length:180 start_codon:yes stop_codon:yes gene_type:complete